jgi:NADH dehydrogenase/NADH:ubiquinone oxidoreductase subunit G
MVTLTIDNRTVTVPEGTTILEAARSVRLDIPTLCYLKDINEIGACRICMVEVEGNSAWWPPATPRWPRASWSTPTPPGSVRLAG